MPIQGSTNKSSPPPDSFTERFIHFFLENKLLVLLLILGLSLWGAMVAPFDWDLEFSFGEGLPSFQLPRSPIAVDAIPDVGENQQIVFTEWSGRSPQDVEDQITYPLTVSLLGVPSVKSIRSFSFFGFSSIYVIFDEDVEFYWTRSRLLEKLNSLPDSTLPEGVQPMLGPDATALGQVFWYTLEGRDPEGNPAGGWDLHELRTVQDWYVRYSLMAAAGVSEVASIGGFVQEYQIDVDPDAMRVHGVSLENVFSAVRMSNVDVGARTIEVNKVEYIVRGLGFIKSVEDIEDTVVKVTDNVPVYIKNVANVSLGPALRRGALDKEGAEAVGGVVVVRYAENPLEVIKNVKAQIETISSGLPEKAVVDYSITNRVEVERFARVQGFEGFDGPSLDQENWQAWLRANRGDWPEWITTSRITVIPFYDRTGLIHETLNTLSSALVEEILVTIIVVLVMVMHLRASILISGVLPLAVLMCFIAMKLFGVDANIVALSGIAIAIGTMVDMGVIVCENILRRLDEASPEDDSLVVIRKATAEVAGAVVTAVSTTVVSFLPVFTMTAAEGKLFKPLAFTKTFALLSSVIVALIIIPPLAHLLFRKDRRASRFKHLLPLSLIVAGLALFPVVSWWTSAILIALGVYKLLEHLLPARIALLGPRAVAVAAVIAVGIVLSRHWLPLGPESGEVKNFLFVASLIGGVLSCFLILQKFYAPLLRWLLGHKLLYLSATAAVVLMGATVWLGADRLLGFSTAVTSKVGLSGDALRQSRLWQNVAGQFPGLGKEFMPSLDEGSFLYMPSMMPHASIAEALDVIQYQDRAIAAIPEVESVVGKIGRVESPLDPAPISMIETVVNYVPEYITNDDGHHAKFRYDRETGNYAYDAEGKPIPDETGRPIRLWRDHIRTPNDIWDEIVRVAQIPGTTSAPRLQPIAARMIMLQTGMRAPMGVKVKAADLETIERVGLQIEKFLKEVPSVNALAVIADRIVGKPYLEIDIDRKAIARYGIHVRQVQDVIEVAVGGRRITTTVEGRERYPVRVRYMRELRDQIESLGRVLVTGTEGAQIPLDQIAEIRYTRGPQAIKSEDTFLVGYVLFDMKPGYAEVDVVEECQRYLKAKEESGELILEGASYTFAGNYENQVRSQATLSVVLPLALFIIFLILHFQFRSVATTSLVFSGIIVAWAGGFILLWLYGQPWFLDVTIFGVNLRELFQVRPINLSVAIWVGFLALFGIASDNGVIIATYLDQSFSARQPKTIQEVRDATVAGAVRRIRPCLMTTGTTLLALVPVLTSTGRGSDIMVPMAIPSFGGMLVVVITVFLVPVLYSLVQEWKVRLSPAEGTS